MLTDSLLTVVGVNNHRTPSPRGLAAPHNSAKEPVASLLIETHGSLPQVGNGPSIPLREHAAPSPGVCGPLCHMQTTSPHYHVRPIAHDI